MAFFEVLGFFLGFSVDCSRLNTGGLSCSMVGDADIDFPAVLERFEGFLQEVCLLQTWEICKVSENLLLLEHRVSVALQEHGKVFALLQLLQLFGFEAVKERTASKFANFSTVCAPLLSMPVFKPTCVDLCFAPLALLSPM